VAEYLRLFSRSQIKTRALSARLNGREVKLSLPLKKTRPGDLLELSWNEAEPVELFPEDLPLEILYEDRRVVVVNKAPGMVVHPGAGNPRGTLANALLARRNFRGAEAADLRPGIVHRLDKDTSGVIIAAWDTETLAFLAAQFKARRVKKLYAAIVRGSPPEDRGRVETLIRRDPRDRKRFTVSTEGGKQALTLYRVIRSWGAYSLLLLRPRTGRTHQLRVHLRHLGYPILGDPVYGAPDPRFPAASLMLHAKSLTITLPGETAPRTFSAPLPDRFRETLARLAGRP
jgi:23S rRNA pseudouridine1911/1915/1917 synthase